MSTNELIAQAEIKKIEAETKKFELESLEISRRMNTPWWHNSKFPQYIVAIVITSALLFGWSRAYLEPMLKLDNEMSSKKNEYLEIQKTYQEALSKELEQKSNRLKEEKKQLQVEKDLLARKKNNLEIILNGTEIAVKNASEGKGKFFSILNSDDKINRLSDFNWEVWSDNYFGRLGYYLIIQHKDVLNNNYITVCRKFELDEIRRKDYKEFEKYIDRILKHGRGGPILALDYSYLGLYSDEHAKVGGVLYKTNGEKVDFYFSLKNWHTNLALLLNS